MTYTFGPWLRATSPRRSLPSRVEKKTVDEGAQHDHMRPSSTMRGSMHGVYESVRGLEPVDQIQRKEGTTPTVCMPESSPVEAVSLELVAEVVSHEGEGGLKAASRVEKPTDIVHRVAEVIKGKVTDSTGLKDNLFKSQGAGPCLEQGFRRCMVCRIICMRARGLCLA
ncbi:hypothetical protein ACOSP7_009375 [Xanthoceras sorbifolium]